MAAIRIAIVGLGKIAHDQHIPAIRASAAFELVAGVDPVARHPDLPVFASLDALLASDVPVDALAMCQPPQARFDAAVMATGAGKHVLLEKPPGATLSEIETLAALAAAAGTTIFAAWHSRYAPAVPAARNWLRERRIERVEIVWKEDVRRWHPGQQWIWEPGGLGVFDPGINALSIATAILPRPFHLRGGTLERPVNRAAPIAADLHMEEAGGAPIRAAFDWRQQGSQTWDIVVSTGGGVLHLSEGGARMAIDGVDRPVGTEQEYPQLYAHFSRLIGDARSDVNRSPFQLVADAFLRCRSTIVEPFED